jgi:hypothetical protein
VQKGNKKYAAADAEQRAYAAGSDTRAENDGRERWGYRGH